MKTFAHYDYFIQLVFMIVGSVAAIMHFRNWGYIEFYFIVGIPQLMSFLIRLFLRLKESTRFKMYGAAILPVWICLLMVNLEVYTEYTAKIIGSILIGSLFYSPIMAILYVYDCYKTYQLYKLPQ